jgi:hypothetical protein
VTTSVTQGVLKLMPDPLLLEPAIGGAQGGFAAASESGALLSDDERAVLSTIGSEAILEVVERYSGLRPLSPNDLQPIRSRHIAGADGDNRRAVATLGNDEDRLRRITPVFDKRDRNSTGGPHGVA